MLDSEDHGLLIDWDLSKDITMQEARVSERTVGLMSRFLYLVLIEELQATWQFMSARLLRIKDPTKVQHELQDDMESFLHVLCWLSLRYVKHTIAGPDLKHLLTSYFDDAIPIFSHNRSTNPNCYTGGHTKWDKLQLGVLGLGSFEEPIDKLLESLFRALGARYDSKELQMLRTLAPNQAKELVDQTKDWRH